METSKGGTWAIVEVLGHRTLAGFVEEVTLAGAPILRVTVPSDGPGSEARATPYVNVASLYMLTPCTEDQARRAAARYAVPTPAMLPPASEPWGCGVRAAEPDYSAPGLSAKDSRRPTYGDAVTWTETYADGAPEQKFTGLVLETYASEQDDESRVLKVERRDPASGLRENVLLYDHDIDSWVDPDQVPLSPNLGGNDPDREAAEAMREVEGEKPASAALCHGEVDGVGTCDLDYGHDGPHASVPF